MGNRRPTMFLVREVYAEGQPYSGLCFGIFNNRKLALAAKRVAMGGAEPACASAEIVPMDLNYRYDLGTGRVKTEGDDHVDHSESA